MKLQEIATRSELLKTLETAGVTGPAADGICKETGKFRHAIRVKAAHDAAVAYVRTFVPDDDINVDMDAACVLIADAFGVGGDLGISGHSTLRHPGLTKLGKGRKRATDGDAYSAAIKEAVSFLLGEFERRWPTATRHGWRLECYTPDGGDEPVLVLANRHGSWDLEGDLQCSTGAFTAFVEVPWVLTIVREGLRRALKLKPWFQDSLPLIGEAKDWATCANLLESKTQERASQTDGRWDRVPFLLDAQPHEKRTEEIEGYTFEVYGDSYYGPVEAEHQLDGYGGRKRDMAEWWARKLLANEPCQV